MLYRCRNPCEHLSLLLTEGTGKRTMSDTVYVEPAREHRQAFARWCLAQNPPIMTASATGSEVPRELFNLVPDEILDGALIEGRVFRPVIEGLEPHGTGYAPEPVKRAAARKPRTRKAVSE